ncbi:MAG: hypothetical protein IJK67_01310 [Bacilli bacterium]|nr:hypothetical protein [Bacilli bacterium]
MKNIDYENLFIGNIYINDGEVFLPAGTYIVEEVYDNNCNIIGYKEAASGEMVVNRLKRKYILRHGITEYDVDSVKPFKNSPGDVIWKITGYPVTCVFSNEEIRKYLSSNPEIIKSSLDYIREHAIEIINYNNDQKLILK